MRLKHHNDIICLTSNESLSLETQVNVNRYGQYDDHNEQRIVSTNILHSTVFHRLVEQEVTARTAVLQQRNRELEQLNHILEQQVNRDALTATYSRRKFEAQLNEELKRQQRYGKPCCLVMLDIDHFKAINDKYGHSGGDLALCQLAQLIQKNIRECDMLARWGGEEFMILLPECHLNDARSATEKIRNLIANHHFPKINKLSCSFGLTRLYPNDNLPSLLARADEALYEAKNLGRNKVVCM